MNYRDRKIVQILHYLISHIAPSACDKMQLLKLVFLADRYHLRKYGSTMTHDAYYAYPYGPVDQHAYDLLKTVGKGENPELDQSLASYQDGNTHFRTVDNIEYTCLSPTNIEALTVAIDKLADLSNRKVSISDYTHSFSEWQNVKDKIDKENSVFPRIKLADCFLPTKNPDDEYCTDIPDDLVEINRELFVGA